MSDLGLISLVIAISAFGLLFAAYLSRWVLRHETGSLAMQNISNAIKSGAEAFLRRQNKTILYLAFVVAVLLFIGYGFIRSHRNFDPVGSSLELATWITISFILGALCSVFAGYIGMWISIRSNIRTAHAALSSLNDALRIALRGGAVSGLLVVSMSLLGVAGLYALVNSVSDIDPTKIPLLIVGYGFGASFVALFAQLGGGIYTKAADVGADLVGKVEAGIPEDDPRNPAVIADLVGDNVGDCAGRGADLFESTAAENIGAMILGASLAISADRAGLQFSMGIIGVVMFPLLARAFGIIASIIGIMFVRMDKEEKMDPMDALNRGYFVAVILAMIGFGAATYLFLNSPQAPQAWWHFFLCGIVGVMTSVAFVYITQYYTEYKYRPVQTIAEASKTGPATNIIAGIAVGFECTALPTIAMGGALLASYYLGKSSGLPNSGLFGTAVATMGMLATAAYILAMDTFGPITDNAGGIVEMSQQPDEIRKKTDRLDAVGNTTKALTKGYAIGSAALAAFLLFQAYIDEVLQYSGLGHGAEFSVDLSKPVVFVGALFGAMLVFLFSALAIRAVGQTAQSIIAEVRRQYAPLPRENDIIQFPKNFEPDYGSCVDIVTKSALRQMVLPGLLVVLTPIIVGLVFKVFITSSEPLIAAQAVAALLMVGTIGGILVALVLNNSGGAWDNAKKYIEAGAHGGKYLIDASGKKLKNPIHAAAVVGDTVGDPFKDTAGPSLHVLIKLLSTITLVLAPLFI
ncbi:MAG: sodium-translocating pyrophosphatase [candidate division Zixibacteria bacterium CG_4_9_14_3_um_filter_46_8]|nr:MAG: sodium-translocating pyrophosphatase [candidate division Zixibacteria bacterium CG_4_9_14_3_um_filter_46_8]